jgi:hypothetical protein
MGGSSTSAVERHHARGDIEMTNSRWAWAALAAVPAIVCAAPAWAQTSTSIVVTSRGETLPRSSIRLFNVETGAPVRMEEEDGDRVAALFLLERGRYGVVVNHEFLREISVDGTGSQQVTIEAGSAATPRVTPTGMTESDKYWASLAFLEGGFFLAQGGVGETDLPTTGIGFQRPSGQPERFAEETAGTFDTRRIGVEWLGPVGGNPIGLGLEYGQGDARTAGEVPAGTGIETGIVYGALSPAGSSGINVGDRGSQNTTDSEFDYWHFKLKSFLPMGGPRFRPFVYANYLRVETRHDMSYHYEGTGGGFVFKVEQDRMQTLEESYFGGGVGFVFSQPLSDRAAFHAVASVGGLFRNSDLTSREHNRSNFGPASDRDFMIDRDLSDDGVSATGSLAIAVEYAVTPRVSLGVGAHVTTISEVGAIFNPSSGDQVFFDGLETSLTGGDALTHGVQIGARFRFQGP